MRLFFSHLAGFIKIVSILLLVIFMVIKIMSEAKAYFGAQVNLVVTLKFSGLKLIITWAV